MSDVVLSVPDLSCEHCERTVRSVLLPLGGVASVAVDLGTKQVRVTYDERVVTVDRIKEALRREAYPVAASVPA